VSMDVLLDPSLVALSATASLPLELDDEALDTPAILIDLDILDSNISGMARVAQRAGVDLRPHAKSHKSFYVADKQLAAGAVGLCVATVGEAEAMWQHGVSDILLAYSIVGERKLERLRPLVDANVVTLVTDSIEVAEGYSRLARLMNRRIPVLLEIDTGMNRVGVVPGDAGSVGAKIASLPGLEVRGILTHAGHAHDATDQRGIALVARQEAREMQAAREGLESQGVEVSVVSAGSTITTPYLSAADGITEVRPGTYVYNDLRTLSCFACTPDQIAATMLATVVSRGTGRATINTGSKSITTSRITDHGFGHLFGSPGTAFSRLSEEHGVLSLAPEDEKLRVGDRVRVLPIHICVWMDLQREVYGIRGGRVVDRIRVDAMRRSL
jgi:D-serine deaminase-like pyridoxal phosphate-dependent protein